MKMWKSICKKLLFLPIWLIISLTVISTIALVAIFVNKLNTSVIGYIVYVVSFYTLTVDSIACCYTIPRYYKIVRKKVYENKYTNRYLTDIAFKTHVSLYSSLIINLIYVAIKGISAVVYQTYWFAIFAVYYAIMAIMRFLLVRYVGKNNIGESRLKELKRSRLCAYILLTINLVLSGVVLMMVYYNRGFHYKGFLIYVIALYTFYTTITAIKDVIKYRKYNSPIMSVSKIIKFASALFSMLFLETAMFSQFGGDTSLETQRIMIMATGAGICVVVVGMSLYMIIKATKEIKVIKQNN